MNDHRTLCRIMAWWFSKQPWCDIYCWELAYNDGFVDAIGITSVLSKDSQPKIAIAEVKRTRADLLADIRSKKMFKYMANTTHCYLAGTAEALLWNDGDHSVVETLSNLGLPSTWGVLLLPTKGWKLPISIRPAISQGKVTIDLQNRLAARVAVSLSGRIIDKNSPITERKLPACQNNPKK